MVFSGWWSLFSLYKEAGCVVCTSPFLWDNLLVIKKGGSEIFSHRRPSATKILSRPLPPHLEIRGKPQKSSDIPVAEGVRFRRQADGVKQRSDRHSRPNTLKRWATAVAIDLEYRVGSSFTVKPPPREIVN